MSFLHRLFKFRIFKFRTTLSEELDDLHAETNHLQQSLAQTRVLQRTWTKWFAIYAILAYLTSNIIYYTLFLPHDYFTRIYASLASIALAALLYGIHWIIRWYFRTVMEARAEKLALFKERKQELIEEVKNKETYAVAKSLLEKYGEKISPDIQPPVVNINGKEGHPRASIKPNGYNGEKPIVSVTTPSPGTSENNHLLSQTPVRGGATRLAAGVTPGKLPRAILPPQRTFWGALLDTIVGDGPSKRYALICKSCNSHNGMALEEEFEYLSFRCAYCNYLNGARKQKPVFNPDSLASNGLPVERRETPITDSSDSTEPTEETKVTRRSIRVPARKTNGTRSRSISIEHKRRQQQQGTLSSSEESLSSDKNK